MADPTHTVLIVEDTVELAEIVQVTLELKVFHETHGNRAIAVYQAEKPDLVLLDLGLPDTSGWQVMETMREDQRGGNGPVVIVITAYGDPANRLMGKLQGVRGYLIKPLVPDEIEKVVSNALNLPPKQ
jgi:DNA-binding response OmpR family regulator